MRIEPNNTHSAQSYGDTPPNSESLYSLVDGWANNGLLPSSCDSLAGIPGIPNSNVFGKYTGGLTVSLSYMGNFFSQLSSNIGQLALTNPSLTNVATFFSALSLNLQNMPSSMDVGQGFQTALNDTIQAMPQVDMMGNIDPSIIYYSMFQTCATMMQAVNSPINFTLASQQNAAGAILACFALMQSSTPVPQPGSYYSIMTCMLAQAAENISPGTSNSDSGGENGCSSVPFYGNLFASLLNNAMNISPLNSLDNLYQTFSVQSLQSLVQSSFPSSLSFNSNSEMGQIFEVYYSAFLLQNLCSYMDPPVNPTPCDPLVNFMTSNNILPNDYGSSEWSFTYSELDPDNSAMNIETMNSLIALLSAWKPS
jgi:hypothetical protein